MDYSAISHDPEHPAGTSPWESPRADRTTFPTGNADVPASPLPGQEPSTESTERGPEADSESPDLSAQLQGAQIGDSGHPEEQSPFAAQQSPVEQQRSQLPGRYHAAPRQNPQPPAPVYRIQAKITGLERTGKKDPVLRFDVHVSQPSYREVCAGND